MAADGKWKLVIQTPMGPQEAELAVKTKSASAFDGTMIGQSGEQTFEGAIDGNSLTWQTAITSPMPLTIDFSVTLNGDAMNGEAQLGMFGAAPVKGTRV